MTTPPDPSRDNPMSPNPPQTHAGDIHVAEVTPQATAAHPVAGHEVTDIHIPLVLKLLSALLALVVVSALGLEQLTAYYERAAKRADPPRSPMAESQTPPLPRLEALPRDALAKHRATEDARLTEYRWVDRGKQTVEIPIERAMQLLAERGIPAPAGTATAAKSQADQPPQETPQ